MGIFFTLDITWDETEQDEKVILYFKSITLSWWSSYFFHFAHNWLQNQDDLFH